MDQMRQEQKVRIGLAKGGGDKRSEHRGKRNPNDPPTLAEAGIDKNLAKEGRKLGAMNEQDFEKAVITARDAVGRVVKVALRTEDKKERRAERERQLAHKQLALPKRHYGVVVEDYEWDFEVWSPETGMDRHAANHYPVSEDAHSAQDIVERTKDRLSCAADDCAHFMWTTVPHLAIAIDVLRLRGFRYVTNWTWDKIKIGTGYWNRNRHEHLLLGVRGDIPCPAPGEQWASLFSVIATTHSAKPECFLEMIEAYFPNVPKIELNRRGLSRLGWDAWGNEALEAAE
jgi:N6-adenosine-specific RNA methylase IME4